ncbi:MAG: Asp23/Gls24 family envelope stress response protein [Clostridiales bacterium]|nr:Asp23/Gls24 family envelope stress response protein [Clostridiales bacterium]
MSDYVEKEIVETNEIGQVHISNEVLEIITDISTKEVKGVKGLYGNITDDLAGIFSRKSHTKGILVEIVENSATINLNIVVDFGVKIPEVAWLVQENVKNAIESMTDIKVEAINVNIAGINFVK